jgi:hypothetical protein
MSNFGRGPAGRSGNKSQAFLYFPKIFKDMLVGQENSKLFKLTET